jgi:hypothetical protein
VAHPLASTFKLNRVRDLRRGFFQIYHSLTVTGPP